MVSVYPTPLPKQDYYGYYPMGGDPAMTRSGLPSLHSLQPIGGTTGDVNSGTVMVGLEDPNKKVRKPYTITKSRENWTEQEHDKFLEALQLFDRDWKKIEAFVGSKTVIQIRSHAQKYFLKVQKSGAKEHVPPPRPKRKASHPYPQKAPKIAASQAVTPRQSCGALVEPHHVVRSDSFSVSGHSTISSSTAWTQSTDPADNMSDGREENILIPGTAMTSSSSNENAPRIWPAKEVDDQGKDQQAKPVRAMPDFAQVYRFLGSIFDPNASDHLQRLRKMDPIDVETVLTLMKNLSVNLISPQFEDERQLLTSCGPGGDEGKTFAVSREIQAG